MACCLTLLAAAAACGGPTDAGPAEPTSSESATNECIAPPGAKQTDLDPRDSAEVPFGQQVPGEPITVHFQNLNLAPELWVLVEEAARVWARSPCVDTETEGVCPSRTGCIVVRAHPQQELLRLEPDGEWGDTDGTFTGRDRRDVRLGGRISLNLDQFDEMTSNGRLATITHEIGHALGLVHRRDRKDLMHAVTGDRTDPIPDATDFRNLLVIYGG